MKRGMAFAMVISIMAILALPLAGCGGQPVEEAEPETELHRDSEHGFSISYPKGWMQMPLLIEGGLFKVSAPEDLPTVEVYQIQVDEGTSARAAYHDIWEVQQTMEPDTKCIKAGDTVLKDGTRAYMWRTVGPLDGAECTVKSVVVVAGAGKGFVISGTTTTALYDEHEHLINEVTSSFQIE